MKDLKYALLVILLAVTCFSQQLSAAQPNNNLQAVLAEIFADYNERQLRRDPIEATYRGDHRFDDRLPRASTAADLAADVEHDQQLLAGLSGIPTASISNQQRLSLGLLKYELSRSVARYNSGVANYQRMVPFNQMYGLPTTLAQLATTDGAQPFNTPADYRRWLQRAGHFPAWVDQTIENMREGIASGLVHPDIIVDKMLPTIASLASEKGSKHLFYQPITAIPASFSAIEKKQLTSEYLAMINQQVQPAYAKLYRFLRTEYRAKSRSTVGLLALPAGEDYYRDAVAEYTTTTLTPEQIHQQGKALTLSIFEQMKAIKQEVGFAGDMAAFFHYLRTDPRFYYTSEQQLLDSYRELKAVLAPRLNRLFLTVPAADYEVRAVEPFLQKSAAAASYQQPSADGSRPGIFYVNTYDLPARPNFEREALSLHEAAPGHHFQVSFAMEQQNLPEFRRWAFNAAYVEGWALYAESLGTELGLYSDPYQRLGALYLSIWRANRLVIDTGIHHYGWSRQQAIDWMMRYSPVSDTDASAEVERYIAWPGQALSYMTGAVKIQQLREQAAAQLGNRFDVREFHQQILASGPLPLSMLEQKINRWVQQEK
ncbi:hypothetical protein SIN8267_00947 [Sinobacterium norvegicum]|uniref:DUF885 domain-containing protein n=1 Tax=Sinobacterium norvegicum TaxID=1641715 RepID=A0ABN8EJ03_9GAMM|nr:DUF885 domain-containing protein [Sinobacterium norvegicum]CAH0990847.1 hypothetical protein SIN8267_00947 [Sinobacterium norvegicum]